MSRIFLLASIAVLAAGCSATVNPASDIDRRDALPAADTKPAKDTGVAPTVDSSVAEEDTSVVITDTGAAFDTSAPPFDTSTPFDTGSSFDAPPPIDTGKADSGSLEDKTVGKTCAIDDDCDLTGAGVNICTKGAFGGDSLYPTSVCIGVECDPGFGDTVNGCDGDLGVCLATSGGGICLPACEFKDSTTAPSGCTGKNKCNVYSWGKDAASAAIGIGYCFGGCRADTDCPSGNVCQPEDGLCVKTKVTYTKLPGDACTDLDAKAPAKCNCLYTTAEKKGYCANVCYVGETTCGTGFTCDPGLPRVALLTTDTTFTKIPAGIAGYCLKNCTADSDCTALNGYCQEMAGTGKKTCQLGKRPCAKTADCATGTTCIGATATVVGRCG